MIYFIVWITSVVLWCIGGQFWKPARRYVLPVFYFVILLLTKKEKRDKLKSAGILSLVGINSMGYGPSSRLMKMLHIEWLIRLVYSLLICVPFIFLLTPIHFIISSFLIILCFQLRLGKIAIGKYDLLFEDVARSSAIAAAICLAIYNAK